MLGVYSNCNICWWTMGDGPNNSWHITICQTAADLFLSFRKRGHMCVLSSSYWLYKKTITAWQQGCSSMYLAQKQISPYEGYHHCHDDDVNIPFSVLAHFYVCASVRVFLLFLIRFPSMQCGLKRLWSLTTLTHTLNAHWQQCCSYIWL